ncbi:hypothetical protein P692DRAFT_20342588 [Suillus brevipes Sb2]|nr:hypothetical protein P692DRAFT_20342588 [Suillus brevipes Sb2]
MISVWLRSCFLNLRVKDFDMCFVPSGPLKLEEPELLVVQETRWRQQQKWEEAQ